MKKNVYILAAGVLALASCQQKGKTETNEYSTLQNEVMQIHDEIMPQISHFDRTTVAIDSILATPIDEQKKSDLNTLKTNLETATDHMMTWMHDYVHDSTDVAYQKAEIEKMKIMKKQFEDAATESKAKLGQ